MIQKQLAVRNPSGLHARPASEFANAAKQFSSSIEIEYDGKCKNAKSVIGIMALGIKCGAVFTLNISGGDERAAADALERLVLANCNE